MSFLANELHWFVQCCTWYQMILDGVVKPSHCHGQTVSLVVWCNAESPSLLRISQSLWLDWICIRWRKTLAGHAVDSARPWQHKASELTGQSAATLHHKSGLHWDLSTEIRQRKGERQKRRKERDTEEERERMQRWTEKWISNLDGSGGGVGWAGAWTQKLSNDEVTQRTNNSVKKNTHNALGLFPLHSRFIWSPALLLCSVWQSDQTDSWLELSSANTARLQAAGHT